MLQENNVDNSTEPNSHARSILRHFISSRVLMKLRFHKHMFRKWVDLLEKCSFQLSLFLKQTVPRIKIK